MALREEVKEVIGEMIKIQQVLRATSPQHALNSGYKEQVAGAIARSEELLRRMKEEKNLENFTGQT
jgi:hypothetical protein